MLLRRSRVELDGNSSINIKRDELAYFLHSSDQCICNKVKKPFGKKIEKIALFVTGEVKNARAGEIYSVLSLQNTGSSVKFWNLWFHAVPSKKQRCIALRLWRDDICHVEVKTLLGTASMSSLAQTWLPVLSDSIVGCSKYCCTSSFYESEFIEVRIRQEMDAKRRTVVITSTEKRVAYIDENLVWNQIRAIVRQI